MLTGHAPILETRTLHWPDEAACQAFAQALATRLKPGAGLSGAFIELHGTLGAGKTTWVRHLLRALGVAGRIKSPTYAVLESYTLPGPDDHPGSGYAISHLDFYRFSDPRELLDAGIRDVLAAPGLKLVEWPEHAAGQLPTADLKLHLAVQPDESRQVIAQAFSPIGVALLA